MDKRQRQANSDFEFNRMQWETRVRQAAENLGFKLRSNFSRADTVRLLALKSWQIRYKIPLEEILKVLLDRYHSMFRSKSPRYRSTVWGLGVKIPTLCSQFSVEVIEEYLTQTYPESDQVGIWKQQQRDRLSPPSIPTGWNMKSPYRFLQNYRRKILEERRRRDKEMNGRSKFSRRPYRDNPWRD